MVTFGGTLVIIPENGAVSPGLNIIHSNRISVEEDVPWQDSTSSHTG